MTTQMQTAVGRFVWHDLNSTDVEAAKRFYSELLGWDVEVWKPGEMDYQMISANGGQHGGFGEAPGGAPSHWLGHVVVEDVDAAGKRAQGAGGSIVAGPMDIPEVGKVLIIHEFGDSGWGERRVHGTTLLSAESYFNYRPVTIVGVATQPRVAPHFPP